MANLENLIKSAGDGSLLGQVSQGFFSGIDVKDYAHAAKLMNSNGMSRAPKQKFLFHVFFTINDPIWNPTDKGLLGALVKTVQLPTFSLETGEYVQYNRKRLVHNKITYNPITITLHDDGENHVTEMWKAYYKYYFEDSNYVYNEKLDGKTGSPNGRTDYNTRDIYYPTLPNQSAGWGKSLNTPHVSGIKPAFFKDINIFGLNRGNYVLYTLINPVITNFRHDQYDYSDTTGVMQLEMELRYETVKYGQGQVGHLGKNIPGFADKSRYDTVPGALGAGGSSSTFGEGGLTDTFGAVGQDLAHGNVLGALQKTGAAAQTFGSVQNLRNVVSSDVTDYGISTGTNLLGSAVHNLSFPTPTGNGTANTNQTASPRSG